MHKPLVSAPPYPKTLEWSLLTPVAEAFAWFTTIASTSPGSLWRANQKLPLNLDRDGKSVTFIVHCILA